MIAQNYNNESGSGSESVASGSESADWEQHKGQNIGEVPPSIRSGFIVKVYTILVFQLILTGAVATPIVVLLGPQWVAQNMWFYYLCIGLSLGSLCAITCCTDLARRFPTNYLFLFVFTFFEAGMVGCVASLYAPSAVLMALGTLVIVFFCLTAFACFTKSDFTGCGPYLAVALLGMIGVSFMFMIMSMFTTVPNWASMAMAYAGVVIFSCYIVYDTQMIVGGAHKKHQFSVDDYVFAALNLYLDIINMFLFLLQIFGGRGN